MLAGIPSPGVPALSVCSVLMTPFVLFLLLASSIFLLPLSFSCCLGFSVGFMSCLPARLFYLWVCSTCKPLAPSAWNYCPRLPRPSRSLLQGVLASSHRQQDSSAFFWATCLYLERLWAHSSFFRSWLFVDLPCLFSLGVRVRNLCTYLLTMGPWVGDVSSVSLRFLVCQVRIRLPRRGCGSHQILSAVPGAWQVLGVGSLPFPPLL